MAAPSYRPEVLERVQFGVESVKGTLVSGSKRFHSLMFDLDPKKPTTPVKQAGNIYNVNTVPAKGHTELSAKGDASVTDLIYLLATQLSIPEFALAGTLPYTATFTPVSDAANAKKTLSIEKGQSGSGLAKTVPYVSCTDLELDFMPDKAVTVSAKFMGRQRTAGATLTSSPTTLTPALLFPTTIDCYIATSEAGLSGGHVQPLSAKIKLNKYLGDVYSLVSSTSFDTLVEKMPDVGVEFVFADDATSEAYVDSIDSATQYYVEIIAKGALIESGKWNQFRFRAPIQFADPGEGAAQDVHTISLKGMINHLDDFNTDGGALLIECQSTLDAL